MTDGRARQGLRSRAGVVALALVLALVAALVPPGSAAAEEVGGSAVEEPTPGFHPLVPTRLLDTRVGDGAPRAPLGAGRTLRLQVTGRAGIPESGVDAVVVNLTGTNATAGTFVTAWPTGEDRPDASSLNLLPGQTSPNLVVVPVGADGTVSLFNSWGQVDLVADVTGWFATPAESDPMGFSPLTPTRLLDTRAGNGAPRSRLGAGRTLRLQVTGRAGIPESGVDAVVLNLTGTNPTAGTFVTAWPTGEDRPDASSLNLVPGETRPNLVVVPVGADGTVSLFNSWGEVDLVADVTGWFATPAESDPMGFSPLTPTRLLDTRDGKGAPQSRLGAGRTLRLEVAGRAGIPESGVDAVVLNLTGTNATAGTFVTAWPTGEDRPEASSLNLVAGQTAPNLVIVPVGADGTVSLFNSWGEVDLVADVTGWFATYDGGEEPPPVELPLEGWEFEPATVILTEPGQTATARLVHPDDDRLVPDELDLVTVGDDVVTLEDQGDGVVEITAGEGIGSLTVGGRATDGADAALLSISTTRLVPGVVPVPDEDVVFPTGGFDATTPIDELDPASVPGLDEEGVDPFTWEEIGGRLDVPEVDPANPDAALAPDARIPWILEGAAPATGSVLVGTGGSGLLGRVVEPAGLPTIERDGRALVSLELVPVDEVYLELAVDTDLDDLVAAGIGPAPISAEWTCDEPDPADCEVPTQYEPLSNPEVTAGPAALTPAEEDPPPADEPPAEEPPADDKPACSAALSGSLVSVALKDQKADVDPKGQFLAIRTEANGLERFWVEMGYDESTSVNVVLKVGGGAKVEIECKLADLGAVNIPVPGVLAPFLSLKLSGALVAGLEVSVEGGPSAEFTAPCSRVRQVRLGFRYTAGRTPAFEPVARDDRSESDCPGDVTTSLTAPADGQGIPAVLQASVSGSIALTIGGSIGGAAGDAIKSWVAKYFDVEIKDINFIEAKAGLRLGAVWENTAQVLAASKASSKLSLDLVGEAKAGIPPIEWLAKKVTGNDNISLAVTLWSGEKALASFYRSLNGSQVDVKVDGETKGGGSAPVEVTVDADLEITAPLQYPPVLFPLSDGGLDGGYAYIREDGDWERLDPLSFFENSGTEASPVLHKELTVTEELCERIGEEPAQIALVPRSDFLGVDGWGWAGTFTIECRPAILEFQQDQVSVDVEDLDDGLASVDVDLDLIGGGAWDWELYDLQDHPSWMALEPTSGTFPDDNGNEADTVGLTVNIDCGALDAPDGPDSATVKARTVDSGLLEEATAELPVDVDCSDGWIRSGTDQVVNSGTYRFTSEGPDETTYEVGTASFIPNFVGEPPEWLTISPRTGDLPDGERVTREVSFTVERREQPDQTRIGSDCLGYLPIRTVANETATIRVLTPDRGYVDVVVVREGWPGKPAIAPKPSACSGPGGAAGDPHMTSMDGLRYDAQVVGEYDLLGPSDPEADGPHLQGRMEIYHTDSTNQFARATVITGIALEEDGHTIEVLTRPSEVRIDGELVNMLGGDTIEVGTGTGISITRANHYATYTIRTPSITVYAGTRGGIIGLSTYTAQDPSLVGFLGTPDGDQSNDLVARDGTTFTLEQLRDHGSELYELTDSWRLTDVADSLFTETYAGFDDPNPTYDREAILEYVPQVVDALGALTSVCSGGVEEGNYVVDALAIELANGGELGDLGEYTCSYLVTGRVVTDTGDGIVVGVPGMDVSVRHPSFETCQAVTDPDGEFQCIVWPDLADLPYVDPATLPLDFEVSASWPDDPTVVGTATASFDQLAGVEESARAEDVDVTVDPASFPSLVLDGTLTQDGAPYDSFTTFQLDAYAEGGTPLGTVYPRLRPSEADGSFRIAEGLPRGTTRAVVTARVGIDEFDWQSIELTDLAPGVNARTWAIDHSPPRLHLQGTLTGAGGAALGPVTFAFDAVDDGTAYPYPLTARVEPDPETGAYELDQVLPREATAVTVTARVGTSETDWQSLEVLDLVPGPQDVTFDVAYLPATVQVTGTLTHGEDPITEPTRIDMVARDGEGGFLSATSFDVEPDGSGAYSFEEPLPEGAATVELTAEVGLSGTDWVRQTYAVATGTNELTFDAAFVPTVVELSGTMRYQGVVPAGEQEIYVTAQSDTSTLYYQTTVDVGVHPDGTFERTFELPGDTTDVRFVADIGDGGLGGSFVADREVVAGAANPVVLTIESTELALSGDFVLEGVPTQPDDPSVPATVRSYDAAGELASEEVTVEVGPDGAYSLDRLLAPGSTRAVVEFHVGAGVTVEVTDLEPGVNTASADVEYAATQVDLTGALSVDGALPSGTIVLGVRAIEWEDQQMFGDPPWTELANLPVTPELTGGTGYHALVTLPVPSTIVEVQLFVDGVAVPGARRAARIDSGVLTELEVDLTAGDPSGALLSGTSRQDDSFCIGEGQPLLYNAQVWAFAEEPDPGTERDYETGGWTVGQQVAASLIVPDTTTGLYSIGAELPAGTAWVWIGGSTDGLYSPFATYSTVDSLFEVTPGQQLVANVPMQNACAI